MPSSGPTRVALAGVVALGLLCIAAPARAATAEDLRQPGTPLRVTLLPITIDGKRAFYGPGSAHRSGGSVQLGVVMRSTQWRAPEAVLHELGHALGLSHANVPACRRGRGVCRHGINRAASEYGDVFSIMGGGIDGFGAHELTALGLASVVDARGVAAVRPPGRRDPTVLRLRTARRDWYLETQTHARTGTLKRRQRLPRG